MPRLLPKLTFADPIARQKAERFGMALFLISLGVLFISTAVAYVVIRIQLGRPRELAPQGLWPQDLPPLPWPLAVSTFVLIVSSVTMHLSLISARAGLQRKLQAWLKATTALGVLFLVIQALCWWSWYDVVRVHWSDSEEWRMALTGFYLLSGLHALHVIGGLILLSWVTVRASRGRSAREHHSGIFYAAMYWHFLDAAWLVLYALLLLTG